MLSGNAFKSWIARILLKLCVIFVNIKNFFSPLKWKEKLGEYRRVIAVSRKPDREEFLSTARITALGIAILGMAGFVIYMLYYLIA
jgi:protein transport protein SEC61 subunit gamma and related proteins